MSMGGTPGAPISVPSPTITDNPTLNAEIQNVLMNGMAVRTDHDDQLMDNMAEINQRKRDCVLGASSEELLALRCAL
jgi:hypothetical protein